MGGNSDRALVLFAGMAQGRTILASYCQDAEIAEAAEQALTQQQDQLPPHLSQFSMVSGSDL